MKFSMPTAKEDKKKMEANLSMKSQAIEVGFKQILTMVHGWQITNKLLKMKINVSRT